MGGWIGGWRERERGRKETEKKGEKRNGKKGKGGKREVGKNQIRKERKEKEGKGGARMNEIQEQMDEWVKGGIEGESKEGRKQRRNMIQIMVCQTLGKLDCSRTENK